MRVAGRNKQPLNVAIRPGSIQKAGKRKIRK
jgi:hypothetical protein